MTARDQLFLTRGSGNSFKPALVSRQASQPCETRFIDILADEAKSAAFLKITPRGQAPYLPGIAESNAIAWHLAKGSPLMPETREGRAAAIGDLQSLMSQFMADRLSRNLVLAALCRCQLLCRRTARRRPKAACRLMRTC